MGVVIPQVLTEDRVSGAQIVDGSLRFDTNFYLSRTPGSAGNRRTWTWSGWVKRSAVGTKQQIFGVTGTADADYCENYFGTDNKLYLRYGYTSVGEVVTTQVFRDVSSWYHILFAFDATQSTASNKLKLYINGVEVTSFSTDTRSSLTNTDWAINRAGAHYLSTAPNGAGTEGLSALLSNIYLIDGQALGPEYFGYTDPLTNTWRPKKFESQYTDTPNNINTTWSDSLSASVSFNSSYPAVNAFDGNLETFASGSGGSQYLELSSTFTNVTSLRIKCAHGITLEGETYTISGTGITTKVISSDSEATNLTSITLSNTTISNIRVTSSSGLQPRICAIEINGVILVNNAGWGKNGFYLPMDGNSPIGQDQSGNGNNWTPVNFGGSNTLEKATGALPILNTDGGGKVARVGVRTDSIVAAGVGTCVLALPLVGITSDFSNQIDGRSTAQSITNNGGATASSTISNFYGGSYFFDGSNDYLSLGSPASDWKFLHDGTTAFTVECWLYYVSFPGINATFVSTDWGSSASTGFTLSVQSGNYVNVRMGNGSNSGDFMSIIDTTATIPTNKWVHVAATYDLTTLRLYLDGVLRGSTTTKNTADTGNPLHTVYIGGNPDTTFGSKWLNGYLQDLRIYKGTAKYTQNFIPASTDPDILPDTPSGVSYSSNVALVPSTDGAVAFDGTGDWLNVGTSSDYAFGTGDFTMECFVYHNDLTGQQTYFSDAFGNTAGIYFCKREPVNGNVLAIYTTTFIVTGSSPLSSGRWHHIAVCRSSGTIRLFLNGVLDGSASDTTNLTQTQYSIGESFDGTSGGMNGFISNAHIVKGTALYTSNFTPPTAPLTSVANTKLLCCKSNSSAGAADVSPNISGINDGTVWSSNASGNLLPHSSYAYSIANAFDGSTSTFAMTASSNGDIVATTVTLPGLTSGHTVEFYASKNTNAGTLTFNGSTVSLTSSAGWVTAGTANGTSDNFVMTPNPGQSISDDLKVFAVRVNGTILVDPVSTKGNTIIGATNFNPFTANINAVRGQESGYATLNPLDIKGAGSYYTLSNGNLRISGSSGGTGGAPSTIGVSSGKWYSEHTVVATSGSWTVIGIYGPTTTTYYPGYSSASYGYISHLGSKITNDTASSYGSTYTTGDTIGVALDLDAGTLTFYKNGVSQGQAFSGLSGTLFFGVGKGSSADTMTVDTNFGQKPFKFPPPSGFQPLALANTPRPTIVRPDQYVGVTTYTGNGSTQTISGLGFSPDFVWIKRRDAAQDHNLYDAVRGSSGGYFNQLVTNSTAVENNNGTGYGAVTTLNTDGFTLGSSTSDYRLTNASSSPYVAWCWKAGGNSNTFNIDDVGYATASAAGLTAGTITPTGASVNTKSGFSIVSFNSQSSDGNYSLSHGLNNTPKFIIMKSRTRSGGPWWVYHASTTDVVYKYLMLNSTIETTDNVAAGGGNIWGSSLPTSTTFGFTTGAGTAHTQNEDVIAYLWAEIPGFSKFGSYTGNLSTDGPVVVTGFRPRWILFKRTVTSGDGWLILDGTRNPYNPADLRIEPNSSGQETDSSIINVRTDFLSNGFKIRGNWGGYNSAETIIYAAFAEAPSFNLYGAQANAR